jgi:hypothetical protein
MRAPWCAGLLAASARACAPKQRACCGWRPAATTTTRPRCCDHAHVTPTHIITGVAPTRTHHTWCRTDQYTSHLVSHQHAHTTLTTGASPSRCSASCCARPSSAAISCPSKRWCGVCETERVCVCVCATRRGCVYVKRMHACRQAGRQAETRARHPHACAAPHPPTRCV